MNIPIIIDSYPQSQEQQERLSYNISKLKKMGFDILLTSHFCCPIDIINKTDYFIYEKNNNYYYLDSDILNENICNVQNPVYLKYNHIGDEVFYDRLVVTAWSVAITSQIFNAIKFLYGKGYKYAFYLVDDFICPEDFDQKIKEIIEKTKGFRNYFIRNKPIFSSWFAGFFFGFTIDTELVSRIPNEDFSENNTYQKYFPNCSAEDVLNRIWSNDLNYIEEHKQLDVIFGENKWNLVSSVIQSGVSQLHNDVSSSVHVNLQRESNRFCLMLYLSYDSIFEKIVINLKFNDSKNNLLREIKMELLKGHWYKEYLDYIFDNNDFVIYEKKIIGFHDVEYTLYDKIFIKKDKIICYSKLKDFE